MVMSCCLSLVFKETNHAIKSRRRFPRPFWLSLAAVSFTMAVSVFHVAAQNGSTYFLPGNLVLSRSVYDNNPNNVTVGMTLPPNC